MGSKMSLPCALRSCLAVLGLISLSPGPAAAAQASPWVEIARTDLAAIRQTILDHHPGPVDPLNPAYRTWLEEGYAQAVAIADSVDSLDGVYAVLSWYTSGFDDGHLGWGAQFVRDRFLSAGIIVALRAGRFVVQNTAPWADAALETGMEVLSCDGVPAARLLVDEVMAHREGIPSLEASRVRLAPELFTTDFNPRRSLFETCQVRGEEGERTISLVWRQVPRAQLDPLISRAAYDEGPDDYEVLRPAPDVAWVTVPSLAENIGDNREGLEALVDSLAALDTADVVVLDVRGNRGGNSYWGTQLASALFGDAYIRNLRSSMNRAVRIEWRASEENAEFIERYTVPRYEEGTERRRALLDLVARLRESVAEGRPLVSTADEAEPDETAAPAGGGSATRAAPAARPQREGDGVVLLTDGWCGSACLDFADVLLAIPGVRHFGSPTYADAVYIDNRSIELPSGLGFFSFSMKVYRNRRRAHNEPYLPDLVYTGDRWDTASVQRWVLDVLNR